MSYNYIYIIYLENRTDILLLSNMFFPVTDAFFVQLRSLVFDCEGLFKAFDNTGCGHPPTVSKRGIQPEVEQIGSRDRVPKSGHKYCHISHQIWMYP